MNIDRFKSDHVAILTHVSELRDLAKSGVATHAESICSKLKAMSATIKLHLATEDRVLYPALASAKDAGANNTGARFQREMGGIAAEYAKFASKWNLPANLIANPAGFTSEANAVLRALHQRIQRENVELYPVAEKV